MLKVGHVKEIYEMKGAGRSIRGIAGELGVAPEHGPEISESTRCHEAEAPAEAGIEAVRLHGIR